jgi:hypothetical protein
MKSLVIQFDSLVWREILDDNLNNFIKLSFWILTISITPHFVGSNAKQMYRTIKKFLFILRTFFFGSIAPRGPRPPHCRGFTMTLNQTHTIGRTPPGDGSARRRHLYLTSHNAHKRHTSMPSVGFEPVFPASERPLAHVLDCAAPGIGLNNITLVIVPKGFRNSKIRHSRTYLKITFKPYADPLGLCEQLKTSAL